jgi:hypothetical protein
LKVISLMITQVMFDEVFVSYYSESHIPVLRHFAALSDIVSVYHLSRSSISVSDHILEFR